MKISMGWEMEATTWMAGRKIVHCTTIIMQQNAQLMFLFASYRTLTTLTQYNARDNALQYSDHGQRRHQAKVHTISGTPQQQHEVEDVRYRRIHNTILELDLLRLGIPIIVQAYDEGE
jgi:hypothetical protein